MAFETPVQPLQFTSLRQFQRSPLPATTTVSGRQDNCKHATERRCADERTVALCSRPNLLPYLCSVVMWANKLLLNFAGWFVAEQPLVNSRSSQ